MKQPTRRALGLAFLLLMVVACGTSRKQSNALKRAERTKRAYHEQIKRAIELGAIVDTTTTVVIHDTVRVPTIMATGNGVARVDTVKIYEACTELVEKPVSVRAGALGRLQRVACPPIRIDTTFKALAKYQGAEYPFAVNVQINGSPGAIVWRVGVGSIAIPTKTTETVVKVSPEIPKFRLKWWQWLIMAAAAAGCFFAGFVFGRVA